MSPRSEIDEMLPVVAPELALPIKAPELAAALIVCINCSTFVAPDLAMSCRVMTWTGTAVSASMRLIDEPVISMRWLSCAQALERQNSETAAAMAVGRKVDMRELPWIGG